jgi:hypothetical protein
MAEIASHGYFVMADGTPNGRGNVPMGNGDMGPMGKQMIGYIEWCGGLMAIGTVSDPRITTWGVTSSGMARVNDDFYTSVRTPVLFVDGHGGDLSKPAGGDFTRIILAWLNWQLKGDETATGKGVLVGAGCCYCRDSTWEVKSANIR